MLQFSTLRMLRVYCVVPRVRDGSPGAGCDWLTARKCSMQIDGWCSSSHKLFAHRGSSVLESRKTV